LDIFPPEKRSEIMSKIRSRHTKPEEEIADLLDSLGVKYERYAKISGRTVDFLLPEIGLVIEYRSCFFHYCPLHGKIPKTNREYWKRKLMKNRKRDKELEKLLKEKNFSLLVIWSHDRSRMREIIESALSKYRKRSAH